MPPLTTRVVTRRPSGIGFPQGRIPDATPAPGVDAGASSVGSVNMANPRALTPA
jgi:hypothetical protein